MPSFYDDEDNASGDSGSEENDNDENMEDADDGDQDADQDQDADVDMDGDDGDGDGDDNEGDEDGDEAGDDEEQDENEDNDDNEPPDSPSLPRPQKRNQSKPARTPLVDGAATEQNTQDSNDAPVARVSRSPAVQSARLLAPHLNPVMRPEMITAATYDIVPTIAAPQSTSINAIAALPDMRWVFTGGTDGYIRKYNWPDSVNGKLALTVAQRHPFVDSVVKAGVLQSYWENEDATSMFMLLCNKTTR